jgi:hypothetical protein
MISSDRIIALWGWFWNSKFEITFGSHLKIRIFDRYQGEAEGQPAPPIDGIFDTHTIVCRGIDTRAQRRYRTKRLF